MKVFQCGHCNHALFFENNTCGNCGHLSGYRDSDRMMLTFDPDSNALVSDREKIEYKYCKNKEYEVCNWLIEKDDSSDYCHACQLNRKIPNLTRKKNLEKWRNLEIAKHRLIYQLQKIGLTVTSKNSAADGFCFDFIARQSNPDIMTGHANGVITILIREADFILREQTRRELSEPYRTLIGHLRHEVGHYFWNRLVLADEEVLAQFRSIFGNDELDYSAALTQYYNDGAPYNWQKSYISTYATSHPWEDWAETWAHYLHIMDIVETAYFFGVNVNPRQSNSQKEAQGQGKVKVSFDPYTKKDFKEIIDVCVPLSFAVNSINRAMGVPDVYPFVISSAIVEKMDFIHQLLLPKRI